MTKRHLLIFRFYKELAMNKFLLSLVTLLLLSQDNCFATKRILESEDAEKNNTKRQKIFHQSLNLENKTIDVTTDRQENFAQPLMLKNEKIILEFLINSPRLTLYVEPNVLELSNRKFSSTNNTYDQISNYIVGTKLKF